MARIPKNAKLANHNIMTGPHTTPIVLEPNFCTPKVIRSITTLIKTFTLVDMPPNTGVSKAPKIVFGGVIALVALFSVLG